MDRLKAGLGVIGTLAVAVPSAVVTAKVINSMAALLSVKENSRYSPSLSLASAIATAGTSSSRIVPVPSDAIVALPETTVAPTRNVSSLSTSRS